MTHVPLSKHGAGTILGTVVTVIPSKYTQGQRLTIFEYSYHLLKGFGVLDLELPPGFFQVTSTRGGIGT